MSTTEFRERYRAYMLSPEWQAVRVRILKRAKGRCEKCRKARALQVHHKTYVRLGDERDEDLLAVCGPCHQEEHPDNVFLSPSFVVEKQCAMCPSETADAYAGNVEIIFVCTACGDTTRQARKPTVDKKPAKKRRKPGGRPKPKTSVAGTRAERAQQIEALRSPAGGWTRATLAKLGVPWPPPKGWKRRLVRG